MFDEFCHPFPVFLLTLIVCLSTFLIYADMHGGIVFDDKRWECAGYGMTGKENERIETCINYRRL